MEKIIKKTETIEGLMKKEIKYTKAIKNLITNALDAQYEAVQASNFRDMNKADKNEYDENTSKMIKLEHSIKEMLSLEGKKMLFDLDVLTGTNLAIESRYMFKRGTIEGFTDSEYLNEANGCIYLPLMKL